MARYKKVDSQLDFVASEEQVLQFWRDQQIFAKTVDQNKGKQPFNFYDGPPTANGKPHVGHLITRVVKDVIPRYHVMCGQDVLRKAGWDTHGLPVELEVEKSLGINGKDQIEAFGIESFIQKCRESVWKYKGEWEAMSDRVGYWADIDDPYITYEDKYIESEWWALKRIWEQGMLEKGFKIVPYCPRCGTALSSHEVAQGYKDVTENSAFVKFAVEGEANTFFAVWTTTPWTLPSNVALCVNPDEMYVLLELLNSGERYYLAEALAESIYNNEFIVVSKCLGKELEYKKYIPLFPYANNVVADSGQEAFFVTCDKFVTLTDGTGVVHMAPAFGEDDARIGRDYNLPFVQLVAADGKMTSDVTDFEGVFCKDADAGILEKLKNENRLIKTSAYTHSYPHCWRCDTPLIYYARHSWFIMMTRLRDNLVRNNKTINWIPPNIGEGRFGKFVENVVDWSLSRERYWGTPLPIWICESCGKQHCVGSVEELRQMATTNVGEIELHRPCVDAITLTCPDCNAEMRRVPEVIDCWFDSAAMPFAQWHYPFENKEIFERRYPADFIAEGIDQTRGWFYSLLALSTVLFDRAPYLNCVVLGHVLDQDGIKMSKHLGNVVDPWSVLNTEGADATRWYFCVGSQPWLPSRFSVATVRDAKRGFLSTFWNTYAFYVLYAEIEGYEPDSNNNVEPKLTVMDRWALSRLNSVVGEVRKYLDEYDLTSATRTMASFMDDISNWYVRRGRARYWQDGETPDKRAAFDTLFTVLETITRLAAPFVPFMTETIYQNIVRGHVVNAPESIHLMDYPIADECSIDPALEAQMDEVLRLVVLGRSARTAASIKTRQPLASITVVSPLQLSDEMRELVMSELNVKQFIQSTDADELQDFLFKPQMRLLGKKLGAKLPLVREALLNIDGQKAYQSLKRGESIKLDLADEVIELTEEELIIEAKPLFGLATVSDYGITVALDTALTPTLLEEGAVRETISKLQTMRKEAGFDITDRIVVGVSGSADLRLLLERNLDKWLPEVLGVEFVFHANMSENDDSYEIVKMWHIAEEDAYFGIKRMTKL